MKQKKGLLGFMKRFTVFALVFACITVFSNTNCYASASQASDEVLRYITNNIMYKNMKFEGENQYWKASVALQYRLDEGGGIKRYNEITLTPKFNDVDWLHYKLSTSDESCSGYVWQIYQNPIEILAYHPMPMLNDDIELVIDAKYSGSSNKLILKSVLPDGMISATRAVQIFIDTYNETFGAYPLENFTYYIRDYYGDWLIEYDDNDNIGGFGCLLIDGRTGAVDGIKVDE
jgi:hypothetical protein